MSSWWNSTSMSCRAPASEVQVRESAEASAAPGSWTTDIRASVKLPARPARPRPSACTAPTAKHSSPVYSLLYRSTTG